MSKQTDKNNNNKKEHPSSLQKKIFTGILIGGAIGGILSIILYKQFLPVLIDIYVDYFGFTGVWQKSYATVSLIIIGMVIGLLVGFMTWPNKPKGKAFYGAIASIVIGAVGFIFIFFLLRLTNNVVDRRTAHEFLLFFYWSGVVIFLGFLTGLFSFPVLYKKDKGRIGLWKTLTLVGILLYAIFTLFWIWFFRMMLID